MFKEFICRLLRWPPLMPWVARVLKRCLVMEPVPAVEPTAIRALILNGERWQADLAELRRQPGVKLFYLPTRWHDFINGLFWRQLPADEDDDSVLISSDEINCRLQRFIGRLLQCWSKQLGINCILTCNFWYKKDKPWEHGALSAGIPYFALHKECLKDPCVRRFYIDLYRQRGHQFSGTKILVYNPLEAEIIAQAGVAEAELILTTGCMRIDALWRELQDRPVAPKNQITLFSFRHGAAGIKTQGNCSFDDPQGSGLVALFDSVHGALAEYAIAHSDVDIIIKTKWLGPWQEKIESAVLKRTGRRATEIPNLSITNHGNAQQLMRTSKVVLGLNSTTLVEARLCSIPVIIPFYAEAKEKYHDVVYFQGYPDDYDFVADEGALLKRLDNYMRMNSREGDVVNQELSAAFVGHFDGQNAERTVTVLKAEIADVVSSLSLEESGAR